MGISVFILNSYIKITVVKATSSGTAYFKYTEVFAPYEILQEDYFYHLLNKMNS